MGLNFGNIARDWLAPIAGAYFGYDMGGATGAGIGAGLGRLGGGLLTDEDTGSAVKNAAVAGAAGYGVGNLYDNYLGWDGNFGSMGNLPSGVSSGVSATRSAAPGGMFSGGMTGPLAMMGANALAQIYGAKSAQKNTSDFYNQSLANWRNTAYPNAANVNAQTAGAVGGINQASMLAKQKLYDQMAARGMGGNSGVLAGAVAEEDRARRNRLAQLANNMIQFQNTPMYAPPQQQYAASSGEKFADTFGSSAGLLAGLGFYNSMR